MSTLKDKKILLLNNQGLDDSGGGVSILEALIQQLSHHNSITLISEGCRDKIFQKDTFTCKKVSVKKYHVQPLIWRFAPLLSSFFLRRRLRHEVRGYDIVIALDCRYAFALWKYCRKECFKVYISLSAIPMVAWHDCENLSHKILYFLQYMLIERLAFQKSDVSFVSSKKHLSEVKKYERIHAKPLIVYPFLKERGNSEPVDCNREQLKKEHGIVRRFAILTVSRITRLKNLEYLCDLAERIEREDVVFLVVGDGHHLSHLEKLVQQKQLHDKVQFFGRYGNPRIFYKLADVYLHPSFYESFGCSIYEAMFSGLPVIFPKNTKSYVSAFEELVDEGEALCVDFNKQDNIISTILQLLDDSALRKHIGGKARQKAVSFSASNLTYVQRIEETIQRSIELKGLEQ